jgi:tRNA threonylcarbamoyladenosine biosynthesis protein TsaB
MIILIDTSTPICHLVMIDGHTHVSREWQADRDLAHGLLRWLNDQLGDQGKNIHDITAIGVYQGPGSFTGLRIGLTVMNTLADGLDIPIVAARGDDWQQVALSALRSGGNDRIVLPLYDRDANITTPRK